MSIDYPRAWQIAKAAPADRHHPKCSFRTTEGAVLCDCDVIYQHPEYLSADFHGVDGKLIILPVSNP